MKARTLIVAIGASVALVGATVQPAGAKVASTCSVSQQKVLTFGNGTKAPTYEIVGRQAVGYTGSGWRYPQAASTKSCGAAKTAAKKTVAPKATTATALQTVAADHPTNDQCTLAWEAEDETYAAVGVQACVG
jgi:hypothetical protein